jgi:O-antigen ligase
MTEALSPTGVSTIAATLLLLGTTFYVEEHKRKYLFYAGLGFFIMMLGGGKGAIAAALLAGTTFFILRKNLKQGLMFLIVTVVLGSILVAVTPLQRYLTDYAASGNAETGTGRLGLWELVGPAIMEKPLYGHGYLASRFIAEDLAGLDWPAGHTHNAFLEVLYNNGVIGLALLLAVLGRTVRNLLWVIRRMRSGEMRTWAIGCFAVLIFEFINGMLNASFGGRPASAYLMVMSIAIISEALAGLLQREILKAAPGRFQAAER